MGLIWGTVLSVLGVAGAILIAVAGRVVGDDVKELLPWITRRLIERAVSRLPEEERERFEEEWRAYINDLPGNLAKVYAAWGYLSASKAINDIVLSGGDTRIFARERIEEAARRAIDLVMAAGFLLITALLLLVIAAAIKLDSRGPVLVRQKRVGANNVPFDLLSFRSICVEHADLLGQQSTLTKHPRISRVGRLLRVSNLEGLPQIINVLRGEMSLVGPRPQPPASAAGGSYGFGISEDQIFRRLKPGITGWTQVNELRGETTIEQRRERDLYYLKNRSLSFDFLIIPRTALAALSTDFYDLGFLFFLVGVLFACLTMAMIFFLLLVVAGQ